MIDLEHRRRIRAWILYDWANSAFATTVLAAVLPVYFAKVAATTLGSPAEATKAWSIGVSISLFVAAVISPALGTVSDVMRSKKRFLALFAGLGIVATACLYFVGEGDWLLASVLAILGRVGFSAGNVFYDSLLPHVAAPEERDEVSSRGYALGYLGGGLLLAINVVMMKQFPGTLGVRLSFVSVALWWALFAVPLFLYVPEPATIATHAGPVFRESLARLAGTFRNLRRYRELWKLLVAFLIYNDGIGTIITTAAIYGAELGFGTGELILALLLVQLAGVPFALLFGRLPARGGAGHPGLLGFVVASALALPAAGLLAARFLPADTRDAPLTIAALIGGVTLAALVLGGLLGRLLLRGIAARLDAKSAVLVALGVYALVASWGFVLSTVVEFWLLAWMVAMVQGGSQALSRSLYAELSPARMSGEFFGLFGVMEKLSAFVGPLLFAAAVANFGSSRPAILSLIAFFVVGGWLLLRVDVARGRAAALEAEAVAPELGRTSSI